MFDYFTVFVLRFVVEVRQQAFRLSCDLLSIKSVRPNRSRKKFMQTTTAKTTAAVEFFRESLESANANRETVLHNAFFVLVAPSSRPEENYSEAEQTEAVAELVKQGLITQNEADNRPRLITI